MEGPLRDQKNLELMSEEELRRYAEKLKSWSQDTLHELALRFEDLKQLKQSMKDSESLFDAQDLALVDEEALANRGWHKDLSEGLSAVAQIEAAVGIEISERAKTRYKLLTSLDEKLGVLKLHPVLAQRLADKQRTMNKEIKHAWFKAAGGLMTVAHRVRQDMARRDIALGKR